MEQFLLSDLISSEVLQNLQDAFSTYSGMAALITDANGTPLTTGSGFTHFCMDLTRKSELGCKNCEACDRQGAIMTLQSGKPVVYSCHAGLTDYAAPIMVNDDFIGSFIGGQVRTQPVDEDAMREIAIKYSIDPEEYIAAAKATNQIPQETIERAAQFLSEIASVLSRIAFDRYQTLKQKQLVEKSAQNQSDQLQRFSGDLKQNLEELAEFIERISNPENDEDIGMSLSYAAVLASNTMTLGSMLDETIDFLQIESGNFELKEAVYDLRQMIEYKMNEFRRRLKKKNHTICCNVHDGVPTQLMGDSSRIGTIIGKLVENFISYTENNQISIDVECTRQGYAALLKVTVSDNSIGIEESRLNKIREYITTRGKSYRKNQEFEDMGLAIVGYAVNALHGSIDVTSRQEEGTAFVFAVPQLAVEN